MWGGVGKAIPKTMPLNRSLFFPFKELVPRLLLNRFSAVPHQPGEAWDPAVHV